VYFLNLRNASGRTMALESTKPVTEMSTRNLPGGKRRPELRLTTLQPSVSRLSGENVGASTSQQMEIGVGSEILLAVPVKNIFWNITVCSPKETDRRFVSGGKQSFWLPTVSCWFLSWLFLRP
jgi:hypothetical protein